MKPFTDCPICATTLVRAENEISKSIYYQNCQSSSDHVFSCCIYINDRGAAMVERVAFTISMDPILSVQMQTHPAYAHKRMAIGKTIPNACANLFDKEIMPFYVEPDFVNYETMVDKIRLYLLFS